MKIYTKGGDKGKTSLLSGNRVIKNHIRIEAYGAVDELSANIGYLRGHEIDINSKEVLIKIQKVLFNIASILALDENKFGIKLQNVSESDIFLLESEIDKMNEQLPELKNFILQGGNQVVGLTHVCRTVCRRCERTVISLSQQAQIEQDIIIYLNRLSDFLFVLARKFAKHTNLQEDIL